MLVILHTPKPISAAIPAGIVGLKKHGPGGIAIVDARKLTVTAVQGPAGAGITGKATPP